MIARSLVFAGLTAVFWVIPTIATQGMGTIGAPAVHPDAALIDTNPAARVSARVALNDADTVAEAAIGLSPKR